MACAALVCRREKAAIAVGSEAVWVRCDRQRWAAFWSLAPCPMRYRRCQRVGADCPASWGMPEVHGEGIRSERRFGREAVLCPKRLFGRFCRLAVPVMRDSVVGWTN